MPTTLTGGPYKIIDLGDGTTAPLYLIPFDKMGVCEAPETRADLIKNAKEKGYTDVFLFSHGWNNDWAAATGRYDDFLSKYRAMRMANNLTYNRDYHPLFIGVIWPSTALVWDSERGPDMAAFSPGALGLPGTGDLDIDQERRELQSVADELPSTATARFYELSQHLKLTEAEGTELSALLAPLYGASHDEIKGAVPAPTPAELLNLWKQIPRAAARNATGNFGAAVPPATAVPTAAGFLGLPSPRDIIRATTVWRMKDRAGTVGSLGVGPLLDDLLASGQNSRVHLIGHSYGCKIVLSALCYRDKSRPVDSVLLLQPAVSALCFAADVDGANRPGGYRNALDGRVSQPIMSTFSKNDFPLTRVFQFALRRDGDVGEVMIGAAPSKYAALGGFGPQGLGDECHVVVLKSVGDKYDLGAGAPKVYGLNGDASIAGHGEISVPVTWWALYNQVAR